MLRAAVILGLAMALTACGQPGESTPPDVPETTVTDTRVTRLSKPPHVPRTLTRTASPTNSAGTPVPVPEQASHKACRLPDWNDLPADVRPAHPSPHVTEGPEQCRIGNSLVSVGTEDGDQYFTARTLVSQDLSPIEQFTTTTANSTGRLITLDGQKAVERVWSDDASLCAVYLEPAPEPLAVMIENSRFPQYAPCDLARSLAEAILRRYY